MKRCLRKGDSLTLFLFTIVGEDLSGLTRDVKKKKKKMFTSIR